MMSNLLRFQLWKLSNSSGDGWINSFRALPKAPSKDFHNKKSHFCHFCNNGFCNVKNLKNHIEKFHQIIVTFSCDVCDFKSDNETEFKKHEEEKHKRN